MENKISINGQNRFMTEFVKTDDILTDMRGSSIQLRKQRIRQ